jgi:dihydrofolate synthase/folylpolyglutamate synthase
VVLDVAHNPQAAQRLSETLQRMEPATRTVAVFAMLKDKDIAGVARVLAPQVSEWIVAPLGGPRGSDAASLERALRKGGVSAPVEQSESPAQAFARARERAGPNDRIVVVGSFYTVADVLASLS